MDSQSQQSPRRNSSPSIPLESTTLEQIQVKLVEALHEMQKDTSLLSGICATLSASYNKR